MGDSKVFLIWSKQQNDQFGLLEAFLAKNGWRVVQVTETKELNSHSNNRNQIKCLAILSAPSCAISPDELKHFEKFCHAGNSMIVSSNEDEIENQRALLNELVSRYGIRFNNDSVIRPNLYKHYHPKVALLEDFVVNRGLLDSMKKFMSRQARHITIGLRDDDKMFSGPRILYARGCTLDVNNKVSTVMMTSSKWAIPTNQAICAFHKNDINPSRVVAIGSSLWLNDEYLNCEDNKVLLRALLEFIVNENFPINISDARTIEIPRANYGPDVNHIANLPISCLQESEPLPDDPSNLLDKRLFNIDCSMVPTIMRAYRDLNVDNEPLSLIKPNLELRLLRLEPATHGFLIRRSNTSAPK